MLPFNHFSRGGMEVGGGAMVDGGKTATEYQFRNIQLLTGSRTTAVLFDAG